MNRVCAILCLAGAFCWAADDLQSALNAAQASLAAGDYAHASERAEQAAAGFHSRHDLANEKLAVNIAGSAYLYRGDYDLALARYQAALQMDRQQHDINGEITRLTNIGSVYFYRGRYSEALAEYQIALKRVQQTGAGGQLVFTNLATLYQQLGENQKALDYYRQALASGQTADLLTNIASLYRTLGDPAKAMESYRAARALAAAEHHTAAEVRVLEEIGVTQAVDLHDLNSALLSFNEAVKLAAPNDLSLARLYRGEALYRLNRLDAAVEDFRAAGDYWLALYRLGDLEKALAVRYRPLPSGFFPAHRELYDAAIHQMLQAGNPDAARLFELLERLHDSPPNVPPLQTVQARLSPGSLLVEYWTAGAGTAAVWATKDRVGIATNAGIPSSGTTQLLIVPDGPPTPEQSVVSYLPYASLLVRDEPWRTPLMPWRSVRNTVYTSGSPILLLTASSESLFPAEIQSLPLAQTDLVVLSAPDPMLVRSRAFLAAGARSTLATLRAVPENVAHEIAESFLSRLARGESKAAALHETKLAHPQYASAFVLIGDGQQPTRPVLSWWWPIGAAVLAAGVIIVILRR